LVLFPELLDVVLIERFDLGSARKRRGLGTLGSKKEKAKYLRSFRIMLRSIWLELEVNVVSVLVLEADVSVDCDS